MTIDEAKEWLHKEVPTEILLERIYEEFKIELEAEYKRGQEDILSRTCEGCKHYTYWIETDVAECSANEPQLNWETMKSLSFFEVTKDFGCNKWEQNNAR